MALLVHMVAHVTGKKPGRLIHVSGDAHVYLSHFEGMSAIFRRDRKTYAFPKLEFTRKVDDIDDFKCSDFKLVGYRHAGHVSMPMAV